MTFWRPFLIAAVLGLVPTVVAAQLEDRRPFAWDVARAVLIDPTTYAPALISYEALRQDWKTSQGLFASGWVEKNPRYTISGRPNDVPVSYNEGIRRIRRTTLVVLQYSVINNAAAGVAERLLIERHPDRKTLIRAMSWIERIAFASILAYSNSADHWRQASANRRLALEYAYAIR
jgi:hypothetical protein